MAECGCITIPDAIALFPGENTTKCGEHGWQKIVRKATSRENLNFVLERPLDFSPEIPDEPPF